ncbi:molecular chaperone DnaK (HSP70) [Desulfobotulus alkaliphilus]|uniref:Molecular chaperone DnaK (HSP70) n=1 Tax=Desulfobotulus alkaliphilus TaxID=622671 RepID=A0A562S7W2_9BACT|nr:Hsp70 family protein [Desulfobotulus alkaliphilus]TWI77398.1 molecular chaperone DnaK (HSP70) [Desulfobotulus alkaliphilus]
MTLPSYVVGIDLGTSNTVVAYAPLQEVQDEAPEFSILDIPQINGPGVVESAGVLPSFLYIPEEREAEQMTLPWGGTGPVVGIHARDRGAEVPGRQIASSKSWLCSDLVDREGPVLPWESEDVEAGQRLSPVAASAAILAHVRAAWNHHFREKGPEGRLENQEIFLTVPASFDAVARDLTVRAAREAGLQRLVLLEEPQAAFYAWIAARKEAWREHVQAGDTLLVCDVGGGTSDFSLIRVQDAEGRLELERIAVGKHLLVGGDNMDLTLAYHVAAGLAAKNRALDAWQMRGMIQRCRQVKESLLEHPEKGSLAVSIAGRGSGLIAGTIKSEVSYEEVQKLIMTGFFPECGADSRPVQPEGSGLSEFGLGYEADPAITRHLAAFLTETGARPSAVLFNGGVMKPAMLRQRVRDVMASWQSGEEVRELVNEAGDRAVALGAAYYGWARRGKGIRIRSGLNRSYYIGVAAAMPAVPGIPMPKKALCIAPFGMEEGTEVSLRDKTYMLSVGVPASFELLASTVRKEDAPGAVVEDWQGAITPVTRIETLLEGEAEARIPVTLAVRATEVGTLEFFCVSTRDEKTWDLAFQVREARS